MSEPVQGIWNCIVLGGEANANDKDIVSCRISVQINEGPDKGRKVTYDEQVNNKSAKYVVMSAMAVGWRGQGRLEDTFRRDVDAWIAKTGGASTVEIQNVNRKDGTIWGKARSIGRGLKPLKAPSRQASDDADEAIRAALADAGNAVDSGAPPADDVPPPGDEDSIPFITLTAIADRDPITRSWR
jgi:hypothetical protein